MDDDELLAAAQHYGIQVSRPQPQPEPGLGDDELLSMAKQYGIKATAAKAPPSPIAAATRVRPAPPSYTPSTVREVGSSSLGDWVKGATGFDLDSALAPARKARREQQALNPVDELGMKMAAGANAALDIAEIVPNIALGTDPGRYIQDSTALTDPRFFLAKQLLPFAAQTSRNATQAGKRALVGTRVAKQAPEAYKQYSELSANLAPFPNLSAAEALAKAGLPAIQNAIKAGRILPSIADNALTGAGVAGAVGASQQYDQNKKIDPLTTLLTGALGGAAGGSFGTAAQMPKMVQQVISRMKGASPAQRQQLAVKLLSNQATRPMSLSQIRSQIDATAPTAPDNLDWFVKQGLIDPTDPEQAAILNMQAMSEFPIEAPTPPPVPLSPELPPQSDVTGRVLSEQEAAQFRYNAPEKLGYERHGYFDDIDSLPADRIDRVKFRRMAEAGAQQKYLEQLFEAKLAAYARKHGEADWMFDNEGLQGGIDLEPNLSRDAINELDKLRFDLADGTYDKYPQGIRGLSEAGYGQGKSWLPAELPAVSDDPVEAAADLIASRRQYLDAQKAFKAVKDEHKDMVFAIQDRLRQENPVPEGQAPMQLQVIADLPHPAGSEYGRVKYGIETYHNTMGFKLSAEAQAVVKARRTELENELTQGLSKNDWKTIMQAADSEISTNGGLSPLDAVQKKAMEIAQRMGGEFERLPYKVNLKMSDWRRASGAVKEQAQQMLESKAARGSLLAASLGILSQLQPAEAADGKEKETKSGSTPLVAALMALGLYVGGIKSAQKLGGKVKALAAVGNLWRDTMDMVQLLDKEAGTDFYKQTWKHLAGAVRATWGVQFDNPEQLLQAVQEFKSGKPGDAFNSLSPSQQNAIRQQTVIKRNLLKLLNAHIQDIEERLDPNHTNPLQGERVHSGLATLKKMSEALTPAQHTPGVLDKLYSGALGNIMDYFFFWNPEHHLTNLTDQWIAGGSRVGVHNIAHANALLNGVDLPLVGSVGGDGELRILFNNSNLLGGLRVERAEQKAIAAGKPQNAFQKFMNTDIPSDQINADRVALASILEYAQINRGLLKSLGIESDKQFAKELLKDNVDPSVAMDAWVHMTERMSRTLGVDPMRINKDYLSRQKVGSLFVFFKQPARMARLMTRYVADGNYAALATVFGMAAMFGGRAAIPDDLSSIWSQLDPDSYFKSAKTLDNLSAYSAITGENNASKLSYGTNYLGTGSGNIVLEMGTQAGEAGGKFLEALSELKKHGGDYDKMSKKEKQQVLKSLDRVIRTGSPLVLPRLAGIPMRGALKAYDNMTAAMNDSKRMSFYEGGKRIAKSENVKLSDVGVDAFDMMQDLVVPGTPIPLDTIKQSKSEEYNRKKALIPRVVPKNKQAYTYPSGKTRKTK